MQVYLQRGEGYNMIELITLNGGKLFLNYFQILCVELIPETKVIMNNGHYYLVRDTVQELERKIEAFIHGCIAFNEAHIPVSER